MAEGIRLNRFIASAGVSSRRGADALIAEGRVMIDGRKAVVGDVVIPDSVVCVDGKRIQAEEGSVIIAYNKPRGITCTSDPSDPDNIISAIGYPKRIYTIGRLDKDSEGLILLTNDGDLANRIMRARYDHEKEYVVSVDRVITDEFLSRMSKGVLLDGRPTRRCFTERIDDHTFCIILRQGIFRQIRRMCGGLGYTVVGLVRIRVVNIELGDLPSGKFRDVTGSERDELFKAIGLE